MGHALVAASLPGVDPVLKVSIIPRGVGALGYTEAITAEDFPAIRQTEPGGKPPIAAPVSA